MAKKKQHKKAEIKSAAQSPDEQPYDEIYDFEPDFGTFEGRSYRQPSPYEIASLSIALSKGINPKKHMKDAYDLYWSSYSMLREKWEFDAVNDRAFVQRLKESNNPNNFVLLDPTKDRDQARDLLRELGLPWKKADTVKINLIRYYDAEGDKEQQKENLCLAFKRRKAIKIPRKIINGLAAFKKRIKHEGGNKAAKTAKSKKSSRK